MKRVIVDVDVGTDDAHGLLLLLHADKIGKIKLEFITCTVGNSTTENVAKNVIRLLEIAKRTDIPVYKGAHEQLILPDKPLQLFHGSDGFGDLEYDTEPDTSIVRKEPAAVALGNYIENNPNEITLICLGPLTNIALVLKLYPKFAENLNELYLMGGNYQGVGNVTATAEFNFYFDPESAHIILDKLNCPITIVPWETCLTSTITFDWRFNVLGKIDNAIITLLNRAEKSIYPETEVIWLPCDAFLVAAVLYPDFIKKQKDYHVTIELHGKKTRGQLVLDHLQSSKPNVTIIEDIDGEYFKEILLGAANGIN